MQFENGKFEMLHGQDETLILGLTLGAKGGVGGTYNHCFSLYRGIVDALMMVIWQKQRAPEQISGVH